MMKKEESVRTLLGFWLEQLGGRYRDQDGAVWRSNSMSIVSSFMKPISRGSKGFNLSGRKQFLLPL